MTDATTMTQRERDKLRRDILRIEGVCIDCGRVPAEFGYVRCGKCLEAQRGYKRNARAKAQQADETSRPQRRKRKAKGCLSIADVNRMAAERGISYGMMVLELESAARAGATYRCSNEV